MRCFIRGIFAFCLVLISGVALPFLSTSNDVDHRALHLLDTTPVYASPDWIRSSVHSRDLSQTDEVMDMEATELKVLKRVADEICPDQMNEGDDEPNPYALGDDYFILNCEITVNHINSVHIQRFESSHDARAFFGQQDDRPSFPPSKRIYPSYETEDVDEHQTRHYWLAERWIISSRALDRTTPKRTQNPLEVSLIVYDVAEDYGMFSYHTSYLPIILS